MSVREARECVELCAAAGIALAVNQNMRYDQSVRAMKDLLQRGWLGEPVLATIDMRAIPHWMPWSEALPSLSTFVMSIHHLDTFRYWFGTPDRVLASTRPDPRTRFPHRDGINLYILEYDNGCRPASWDDVWTGPAREGAAGDIGIRWRVEGTEGLARGTIGWPSYPARTPSTLDFTTQRAAGLLAAAALAGGVVPRRLRRHDGPAAVRPGRRHRAGDQRPRQPGDDRAVRGGVRGGDGASGDDGAGVPGIIMAKTGRGTLDGAQPKEVLCRKRNRLNSG